MPVPRELSLSGAGTAAESRCPGDSDGAVTPGLGGDRRPLTYIHGLRGWERRHPAQHLCLEGRKEIPAAEELPFLPQQAHCSSC